MRPFFLLGLLSALLLVLLCASAGCVTAASALRGPLHSVDITADAAFVVYINNSAWSALRDRRTAVTPHHAHAHSIPADRRTLPVCCPLFPGSGSSAAPPRSTPMVSSSPPRTAPSRWSPRASAKAATRSERTTSRSPGRGPPRRPSPRPSSGRPACASTRAPPRSPSPSPSAGSAERRTLPRGIARASCRRFRRSSSTPPRPCCLRWASFSGQVRTRASFLPQPLLSQPPPPRCCEC